MPTCDVHNPDPCTNQAAYRATKRCGCTSYLCVACLVDADTHVVACPEHRVYFDPGNAHANATAL
jgi:hypothetical protein